MTSEAVTGDPGGKNGAINYTYDAVGNRNILNATLPPAGVMNYNYNANDQLSTDNYDANGNTVLSAGVADSYDFENYLIQKGAVTMVYDGDGNRVSETVGGVTTQYLVDTQNPTGYAQVVDELQNGTVTRSYSYGLEHISQNWQPTSGNWQAAFYGYDGHGSVRQLFDSSGTITDTYDYDAFGNLINSTGSTPNNYLFAGEQFDPALNLYYNRARYLNTNTGRFWSMDTLQGDDEAPISLHKYLYVEDNPVIGIDPSGNQEEAEELGDAAIESSIDIPTINVAQTLSNVKAELTVAAGLATTVLEDPNVLEEVEGTGQAGIQIVQQSFLQMENILTESEAEATSIAEDGPSARRVLNQLYTRASTPNPGGIEYHHIVEQGGVNASRFGRALQSFGNIMPLSEDAHDAITNFYASTQEWLPQGMRFRDWMATQDWESQWTIGLQIVREVVLNGKIDFHL